MTGSHPDNNSFARALDMELGSGDDDGRRLLKLQKRFS
jgi:hypothetical protein